jgi:hypothetical protein
MWRSVTQALTEVCSLEYNHFKNIVPILRSVVVTLLLASSKFRSALSVRITKLLQYQC